MKTVKSLLLGSAAGFVALTGAQAADLPLAEPVEYVKVCSTYGEGFFYIPGTDTCLQISGRVRVEGYIDFNGEDDDDDFTGTAEEDNFSTRARGVIAADARTETEWGTLRSYIEYEANNDSGLYDDGDTGIDMVAGFVQFAGITAGFAGSFFDFAEQNTWADFFSSEDVWTLAYTASFGSGFAATIAIEDKYYRARPFGVEVDVDADGDIDFAEDLDQTWPNVVAALRVDQAWGSAQISAAVQDNAGDREDYLVFPEVDDEVGFAVQAAAKFNLPFANEGSYAILQGVYSEGATSYAGAEEDIGFGSSLFDDAVVDQSLNADGELVNNTLWGVGGGFGFQATETVQLNAFARFSQFTDEGADVDVDLLLVEGNVVWTPVDNLDLGLYVLYGHAESDDVVDVVTGEELDEDDLRIITRIQRDF